MEANHKHIESLSDSPPNRRNSTSKKEKMSEMQRKIKKALAKVQELENDKIEDREQFKRLLGESEQIQELTAKKAENVDEMRSSSIRKSNEVNTNQGSLNKNDTIKSEKKEMPKSVRLDKSYSKESTKIRQVKQQKIKLRHETIKNFTIAFVFGVILILLLKILFHE